MKKEILKKWNGRDLKQTKKIVGFEIKMNQTKRTLLIHQNSCTLKLLERMGMSMCNSTELPVPVGTVLGEADEPRQLGKQEVYLYQKIVGSGIYFANNTRSDIAHCVI
ncbi:hypothetical protein K3495_g4504 [Podosphaera aphanis]|nr:hypothetical protein K3495_g4504 [Podosphaera aphanis]